MSESFVNDPSFLQALSIVGMLCTLASAYFAVVPLHRANGSSFLLQGIIGFAIVEFFWATAVFYSSFSYPNRLPDSGILLAISLFARTKPVIISIGLFYMAYRIRKGIKEEGH